MDIEKGCKIGEGVKFFGSVHVYGNSVIEDGVEIFGETYIFDSHIGQRSKVMMSVIEGAEVGKNVTVGPFAHLRKGSKIGDNARIGNFVEIKNSSLGEGTKAAHLAYVGDAEVGERVNIGCGVIFANYDGKRKQKIKVGKGTFIGSNSNLIAPLNIGEKTYICAGTTVTDDTDAEDFVIGRVKQIVKPKKAKKYLN